MSTPTRNGRPTEAGTPVVASTGASRHSTTCQQDNRAPTAAELDALFPTSFLLERMRSVDENATDGAHDCAAFGARDYWALAPEDVPALLAGGEPHWTILALCLHCLGSMVQAGWLCQATTRIGDPYVVAEIIGDVSSRRAS